MKMKIATLLCMLMQHVVAASQTTTPCIQNPGAPNPWPNPAAAAAGYIVLGNMGQPNVFSVSLWVNPDSVQNPQSILLDCNHGGASNWVIQSINAGANWAFLNCNFGLKANRWQHLLCTYNNGVAKVFVDGKLQSQCNWLVNWNRPPFNVHLGNWPEGGRRFSGSVDEIYITNNVLADENFIPMETVDDVNILTNTFGLWHFDEATALVSKNTVTGANVALNNWTWSTRTLNGPFKPSYQIAADLIEFGAPVNTRLLTGVGSGNVVLKLPSVSGTLAVNPMTLSAPSGFVVQYAADTVPSGYLLSNGQNVSRTGYSELYSKVGITYGAGDGTSTFALPDLGPIPTNGLVGWWPFNSNANDESGLGTNGVITGATLTTDRFGYGNSAYYFDGNDQIDMPNYGRLVNKTGTISLWFKTAYGDKQVLLYIEQMPGNLNEHAAVGWYTYPDRMEGCIKYNSSCRPGKGWIKAYTASSYQDDKWHNAIMTWGDGNVKLYLDGAFVAFAATPANYADVCADATLIVTCALGTVDDIAVYDRILNAEERSRLFGSDSPRIKTIIKH